MIEIAGGNTCGRGGKPRCDATEEHSTFHGTRLLPRFAQVAILRNTGGMREHTASLRDLSPSDIPTILNLNNEATPAVPTATSEELAALLEASSYGIAATSDNMIVGFVIGFEPGKDYASPNYRFFEDRGTDHLYVDRIVVAESSRGMHVGASLYNRVADIAARQGRAEVTCEVNLDPPNPESLAFHDRMGFRRVGEQVTGYATVALLARPLTR